MHLAGGRHSEIIARLERHLALAVVQSHQIALACALGSIDPSHPQAIDTFELIIEQWAYDLDARMMAVRGLHRIAPEPPLVLKTCDRWWRRHRKLRIFSASAMAWLPLMNCPNP